MISIHSLRMEGDAPSCSVVKRKNIFQSTPSAWRETSGTLHTAILARYFNPLPPHGGRRKHSRVCTRRQRISIHSLRMEGDHSVRRRYGGLDISIHSLRMEGDFRGTLLRTIDLPFQSTPSAWRETHGVSRHLRVIRISIHSLRMEGDTFAWMRENGYLIISIHSLRMEGDHRSR